MSHGHGRTLIWIASNAPQSSTVESLDAGKNFSVYIWQKPALELSWTFPREDVQYTWEYGRGIVVSILTCISKIAGSILIVSSPSYETMNRGSRFQDPLAYWQKKTPSSGLGYKMLWTAD